MLLTSATHPQSEGVATDYIETSQVFVSSNDDIYVVGDMIGTFFFNEDNPIISDIFSRVFIAKLDNDLNWIWARSLEVNTPTGINYDPKLTVLENKNLIVMTNFGFGNITYYMPENDGTEEIYSQCEGSGTLDLIVSKIDTNGHWLDASLIPGTISNMSIDIVSILDTVYIAGSRLVTTERTDAIINGINV